MGTTETDDLTISFNARRCIHARKCVLGLPQNFVPSKGRDWIQPEGASTEALVRVIEACPSGALSYARKDDATAETPPPVNTARLWEHGPVELHGDLVLPDGSRATRATLCRCGASKRKPFCDNSHLEMRFKATSEPPSDPDTAEAATPGGATVGVVPLPDGPLKLEGAVEVIAGSGRRVKVCDTAFLCRCGASANKPFCDGAHSKIGFKAE